MARSTTTAILFWLMLLGIGVALVLPTVKLSFGGTWSPLLLTIAGELVLPRHRRVDRLCHLKLSTSHSPNMPGMRR